MRKGHCTKEGMHYPALIVMLTYNDKTVNNAYEIFDQCKDTKAGFWGFKEKELPLARMKELYAYMKRYGKTTFLEVVEYTEEECLAGAKMAVECKCDILMGTLFYDSVNDLCKAAGVKYMPFVGKVSGRPSVLNGTADEMITEAKQYLEKGVYGIDLLGYRYTGDAEELNRRVITEINAPVCIAGNVNSLQKLDKIKEKSPWAFTIGSAFFDGKFGDDFSEQINYVCEYVQK